MRSWALGAGCWALGSCGGTTPEGTPTVEAEVRPAPAVLLVSFDTTRADALGAYGHEPSPSPTVDALAARGVRFDEVQTTAPLTLPAHSSLFTGRTPDRHGVRDNNGHHLPDSALTVAEQFAQAGWRTGGFVGAVVIDGIFGTDQGFEVYEDGFDLSGPGADSLAVAQWPGDKVRERAVRWITGVDPLVPVFVFVHLYDPHLPYEAPERFRASHDDGYDAEIAFADEQLSAVIDALTAQGRDPWVAVVADHGEGRGDHGEPTHGQYAYRSTMRVPWVLAGPGVEPGVVTEPVSIVDVAPTLLALAGVPALPDIEGVDVLAGRPERELYAETLYPRLAFGFSELRVLQDAQWRYILAPREELYAWKTDPAELEDVAARHPEVTRRLREALLARTSVAATASEPQVAEAMLALGYMSGAATVDEHASYADLPDPKDHPGFELMFEQTIIAARQKPPMQGAQLLGEFLETWPDVGTARQVQALAFEKAHRPDLAREALAPLLAARPDDPQLLARTGQLLIDEGRLESAREVLEHAVEVRPGYPAPYGLLAEIDRRQGRCAAAVSRLDHALDMAPDQSVLLLQRGTCRGQLGDVEGAVSDLLRVLELDPANHDANFVLGTTLVAQGRAEQALVYLAAQTERTPEEPRAWASYGAALASLGRWSEAIAPLRRAVDEPAVGAEPAILLADALVRTDGDLQEAKGWLAVAAVRDPTDARIKVVWSAVYMAEGRVDDAIEVMGGG